MLRYDIECVLRLDRLLQKPTDLRHHCPSREYSPSAVVTALRRPRQPRGAGDALAQTNVFTPDSSYRVDLRRLTFLSEQIQSQLAAVDRSPVLSSDFESTVPGLYFVGVSAANCFGPVLRFAFGADFAVRHIAKHLAKSLEQNSLSRTTLGRASAALPQW